MRPPSARSTSLPAPVKGWNARDALADMDPLYAPILTNWFPQPTFLQQRNGYTRYASGITGWVESVMQYAGGTTNKLFAAAGSIIYDVTSGGAVSHNYAALPGGSGHYLSTPDAVANEITGDIECIAYLSLDNYITGAAQIVLSKFDSAPNWAYLFYFSTTGGMGTIYSTTGSNAPGANQSNSDYPVNGQAYWFRWTMQVDNGAGAHAFKFYRSSDPITTAPTAVHWTQIGVTQTVVGTTATNAGSSNLLVGADVGGTAGVAKGKFYKVYLYNGIGGSLAASMVGNDTQPGVSSFTSVLTAEVWTVHSTATLSGNIDVTGLTNARWQYVNNATAGGNYIQAVNGADKMRVYDGSAWHKDGDGSPYDVTGVDTSTCIGITLAQNRVWLTQVGTLKAWYGPTGAIGGAFNALDLTSFCQRGGYLMAIIDWTMDAGYGMDDMTVFITSNGEVLVYKGSDPSQATTWGLIGRYWIGSPIGRRCSVKWAGDVLIITRDGVQPMSLALQSSRINARISITDVIQSAVSEAVSNYAGNFGWQLQPFPDQNMLILNVPLQENATQQQYVMNSITQAWCNFTGWNAACWELWQDLVYFGGNGYVGLAWNTLADNGGNIMANGLQAFNYFKTPALNKQFTQMRPVIKTNGSPALASKLNLNFDLSDPTSSVSFAPQSIALWDVGTWDSSVWGGADQVQNNWQGAAGVGTCAAPHLVSNCQGINVQWMSTDIIYNPGGML